MLSSLFSKLWGIKVNTAFPDSGDPKISSMAMKGWGCNHNGKGHTSTPGISGWSWFITRCYCLHCLPRWATKQPLIHNMDHHFHSGTLLLSFYNFHWNWIRSIYFTVVLFPATGVLKCLTIPWWQLTLLKTFQEKFSRVYLPKEYGVWLNWLALWRIKYIKAAFLKTVAFKRQEDDFLYI